MKFTIFASEKILYILHGHVFVMVLPDSCLSEEQNSEANSFLSYWKHVFSQGSTDIGCTSLVQHESNLEDETHFKEPYRNIPPGPRTFKGSA